MKFWDSSAILPLLVREAGTDAMRAIAEDDQSMLVWWVTPVECVSALARLEREGNVSDAAVLSAIERLNAFADAWNEVQPAEAVRRTARRLLRVHPLRAADSLQLAAAVVACEGNPATLAIVTLDDRLAEAARREGFVIAG